MHREQHFGETMFPMGMAHMLCLPVDGFGPCPNFYDSCKGAALVMPADLSERYLDYRTSQIDLSCVEAHEIKLDEETKVHIWRVGDFEFEHLTNEAVIREVAKSDAVFGQLRTPRRRAYTESDVFAEQFRQLFPEVFIPYDIEARKAKFESAYRELSDYISKWEYLQAAGPTELRRRFFRETRFSERL